MTDTFSDFPNDDDDFDSPDPNTAELKRIRSQTRVLVAQAGQEIMTRSLELLRAKPRGAQARDAHADDVQGLAMQEHTTLLNDVRAELDAALAAMTDKHGAQRAQHRAACDALHLFRICPRASCRKAQSCRGNPVGCYERADVPEEAHAFAALLVLAERAPWLPLLTNGYKAERLSYESWIAGIDARMS